MEFTGNLMDNCPDCGLPRRDNLGNMMHDRCKSKFGNDIIGKYDAREEKDTQKRHASLNKQLLRSEPDGERKDWIQMLVDTLEETRKSALPKTLDVAVAAEEVSKEVPHDEEESTRGEHVEESTHDISILPEKVLRALEVFRAELLAKENDEIEKLRNELKSKELEEIERIKDEIRTKELVEIQRIRDNTKAKESQETQLLLLKALLKAQKVARKGFVKWTEPLPKVRKPDTIYDDLFP